MSTGKVIVDLSVSLDGFVAGPNDGLDRPLGEGGLHLFEWWTAGDECIGPEGDDRFRPTARSRDVARRPSRTGRSSPGGAHSTSPAGGAVTIP